MATDADALVRKAVVVNLTHLLPLLPDLEKFQPVSTSCSQKAEIMVGTVTQFDIPSRQSLLTTI